MCLLSPSAHPGPWLAARASSVECHSLILRQSVHARQHGEALGRRLRLKELSPRQPAAQKPAPAPSFTSMGATVFQGDSVLLASEVLSPDNLWRDGLNRGPHGIAFSDACRRLVSQQLDDHHLTFAMKGGQLRTRLALRDGDSIPASALWFDNKEVLLTWLAQPGNNRYRHKIVRAELPFESGLGTIYAVLVGAVQYATPHTGTNTYPNTKWVIDPSKGFNEGALELIIDTHNSAGVGKDAVLMVNPGDGYVPPSRPPPHDFQGPLDIFFTKDTGIVTPDEADRYRQKREREETEDGVGKGMRPSA